MSKRILLSFASLSSLIIAQVAHAQPTGAPAGGSEIAVEEVIVTATRRAQKLQEVPLAVTSLSDDDLRARGVGSIADLSYGMVPGVQVSQFSGTPSILGIAIRGHGAADPTQGTQELPVAVYIDGIYLARGQGLGVDLIEPERIEVLRGPQGQLFGRNAEAGLIQYVSKKPSGKFGFQASTSYGSYNENKDRIRVDFPEFAHFAIQVSAIHHSHDAYALNDPKIYPIQQDFAYLESNGFRAAIRWTPTDSFSADFTYDDSRIQDAQGPLTWVPQGNQLLPFGGGPVLVPPSTAYPDRVHDPVHNRGFVTKARGTGLTLAWDVSPEITLKSITAMRSTSRHGGTTLTDSLAAGFTPGAGYFYPSGDEDLDAQQTSQEVQFLGSWKNFELTAGAIYFYEEVSDGRVLALSGPGLFPAVLAVSPTNQTSETNSYGAYAQGTYTPPILDERLEITGGLRFSDDTKEAERTLADVVLSPPIRSRYSTSRWDPAGTIKFKWTQNTNTYVRYATAYRAGGANVRSSLFNAYGSEVLTSYEAGLKTEFWQRRAMLNLAVFHNVIEHQQLSISEQPITNPGLTNTVNRPSKFKTDGVEMELSVRPAEGLTLGLNYSYLWNGDETTVFDNPLTPFNDPYRFYPVSAARHSGSFSVDYKKPVQIGEFRLHADFAYASGHFDSPAPAALFIPGTTTPNPGLPGNKPKSVTQLLNARMSWSEIPVGNLFAELAIFGRNLTNDSSIVYGFEGCAFGAGQCAYRQSPRIIGGEITIRY